MIEKWLSKNEAAIVDRKGKNDIWKLFGAIEREEKVISNFVACKACKKVYASKPSDGTQSLRKHKFSEGNSGPHRGIPDPTLGRITMGNRYTRGSGQVENLTYRYGSGRVTIS